MSPGTIYYGLNNLINPTTPNLFKDVSDNANNEQAVVDVLTMLILL